MPMIGPAVSPFLLPLEGFDDLPPESLGFCEPGELLRFLWELPGGGGVYGGGGGAGPLLNEFPSYLL